MKDQAKMHLRHFAMGALIAALGAGSYVVAAVVFSDFKTETVISASEMNAKLNALKDAVNANAASVTCPANTPTRFTDKGDGTVCDSQTGLMWEIKTGTVGTLNASDPHDVNNRYFWTTPTSGSPLGSLYADFLAEVNRDSTQDPTKTCFANRCDWRIPTIVELRSILELSPNCSVAPCIATGFPGPTSPASYWSSSLDAITPRPWHANFNNGFVGHLLGPGDRALARAVRGGR